MLLEALVAGYEKDALVARSRLAAVASSFNGLLTAAMSLPACTVSHKTLTMLLEALVAGYEKDALVARSRLAAVASSFNGLLTAAMSHLAPLCLHSTIAACHSQRCGAFPAQL